MIELTVLASKNLRDLTENELIEIHIGGHISAVKLSDFMVVSTLQLARQAMASNLCSDRAKPYGVPMTAFAILDQLGSCYGLKDSSSENDQSVKRVLTDFSGLDQPKIESLYAFRNGLMHDASYVDVSNKNIKRIFRNNPALNSVVQPSSCAWDGFTFPDNDFTTWVNLDLLPSLVDEVISQVHHAREGHRLHVKLSSREVLHRYLMWVPLLAEE
jgi:hypothetical protein